MLQVAHSVPPAYSASSERNCLVVHALNERRSLMLDRAYIPIINQLYTSSFLQQEVQGDCTCMFSVALGRLERQL